MTNRVCSKCGVEYPLTAEFFHRRKNGFIAQCKSCKKAYDRAYHQGYWDARREEKREYDRRYCQSHREEKREYDKAYNQMHREERRAYGKMYARMHREERRVYYLKHHESYKANFRAYQQSHSEEYKARSHTRRARIKGNGGSFTAEEIREQYKRQKRRCYYCHQKLITQHIEHVIPLVQGGRNDISNIVISCPDCNLRKGSKLPHEWPEGGRLL